MSTDLQYDAEGLAIQDLSKLDVAKLTPLSLDVISRQATINCGTIGHVAHGKSTVVKALTGTSTIRHKAEKERNITIKLGYANAKIYRVAAEHDDQVEPMARYCSAGSRQPDKWQGEVEGVKVNWELKRHISFVDCPGHDVLMATMLNGAAVMDAALLLVAANEPCPQPQTSEHLAAVEIMRLKHLIILQNKVELIKSEAAKAQQEEIKEFVKATIAQDAPILPISAVLKYNIDVLAQYLVTHVPIPPRNFISPPQMVVIRSFDVNKPGEEIEKLKGGVAGGSILKGVFKMGQDIELRPGITSKTSSGASSCKPLRSTIVQLKSELNNLNYAVPGGLIAVGTNLDPTLTRQDHMVGCILGVPGKMLDIFVDLEVKFYLMKRLVGLKSKEGESSKIKKLSSGELLMINIGSTHVGGKVVGTKEDKAKIELSSPVCTQVDDKIAISRRVEKHWRLIGWGTVVKGTTYKIEGEKK